MHTELTHVIQRSISVSNLAVVHRSVGRLQPYLYILPAALFIFIWIYWPLIGTVELSFFQWNLQPAVPRVPVGFDNYVRVLTLPAMGLAVRNTIFYILGLVPFSIILPLAIAILVSDVQGRSRNVYRVLIFVPVLLAPVVVAFIWRLLLHPSGGIVNQALEGAFGIAPISWFRSRELSLWAITFITGWKLLGFSVLIFSAGLTNVSREYLDAAAIDGATRWQSIRLIVLPLLSPTITFMALLTVILSAQWTFPLINVITQGGPINSTTNIYYLLWEFGFRNFNVGFSSAAAVLFFIAFGGIALISTRLLDRFSFHDS